MKKELIICILFIFMINFISSADENCTPEWHCTNWSECTGNKQVMICVDFNDCDDNSTRPEEERSCGEPVCTPDWNCTEWAPEKCPKSRKILPAGDCGWKEGCEAVLSTDIWALSRRNGARKDWINA